MNTETIELLGQLGDKGLWAIVIAKGMDILSVIIGVAFLLYAGCKVLKYLNDLH